MPEESENTSKTDGNNSTGEQTSTAGDAFTPITSQEELNRVLTDRLTRERAKFSDYKDIKAKAARLDELEQANQTELEKANSRVSAAETERDQARAETLRYRVAAAHGISDEDTDLFLTGIDEETLTKQARRLTDRDADQKKQGNLVPREGTTSTALDNDERAAARQLFGGG